ncbi:MazG family protein [Tessaracoccus sp. OS52]|uniref:MazG family protein n=1 Tax=Tessaracoccus sp. OS52 TaxID=2886691 RepID=UPI001D1065D4|nr:MazG family protein [Tessaracoccus sp. OS52]MCC2593589.1 MazG family protein [Tessaracoccus sp. OS52]
MSRLRTDCPWDAQQTHESLLNHLIEETSEVVDAVEAGDDEDLREELGDVLLQVYFHAQIATDEGRFTIDDVAAGIADKLIRRHPHVFAQADAPTDIHGSWERAKQQEKGRRSAVEGIAESLSSVARLHKVVSRARAHKVPLDLPQDPISADEVGARVLELVARAQASGVDADAAIRTTLRQLESRIRTAEEQRDTPGSSQPSVV